MATPNLVQADLNLGMIGSKEEFYDKLELIRKRPIEKCKTPLTPFSSDESSNLTPIPIGQLNSDHTLRKPQLRVAIGSVYITGTGVWTNGGPLSGRKNVPGKRRRESFKWVFRTPAQKWDKS